MRVLAAGVSEVNCSGRDECRRRDVPDDINQHDGRSDGGELPGAIGLRRKRTDWLAKHGHGRRSAGLRRSVDLARGLAVYLG